MSELVAGLWRRGPSLVTAVAQQVIDRAPGEFVRFGVERLGTRDKPALIAGTIALSLLLGAAAGIFAARRRVVGDVVFVVFAALGVAASIDLPRSSAVTVASAAVAAAAVGAMSLRLLLTSAAHPVMATSPRVIDPAPMSSRRRFLLLGGGLAAAALVSGNLGRLLLDRVSVAAARAKIGLPRPRRPAPQPPTGSSFSVAGLSPLVTANDRFYRIDTALAVPQVDPKDWRLRVHGRVDHSFELTFDELLAMPMVEEYVTLSCVSNEVGGPLIGTATWLGVPIRNLLERAGIHPGADQVVGRSVDGFTVGFPTAAVLDGRTALVAVGMNGEPLPVKHGFPARLVIAGLYGYVSATKWVTELEATTFSTYDAYWVPLGWAQQAPVKTESRIDVPPRGNSVSAGSVTVAGVAWAPTRGIAAVEVQIDDIAWQRAQISAELSKETWRQWLYRWNATPGNHQLRVRAIDGTGATQDPRNAPPEPDGATGYHTIDVTVTQF